AREATAIVARLQGEDHPDMGRHLLAQSVAESGAGDTEASYASARRAADLLARTEPSGEDYRLALGILVEHLLARGEAEAAHEMNTTLMESFDQHASERDWVAVVGRFRLGRTALLAGKHEEGLAALD